MHSTQTYAPVSALFGSFLAPKKEPPAGEAALVPLAGGSLVPGREDGKGRRSAQDDKRGTKKKKRKTYNPASSEKCPFKEGYSFVYNA